MEEEEGLQAGEGEAVMQKAGVLQQVEVEGARMLRLPRLVAEEEGCRRLEEEAGDFLRLGEEGEEEGFHCLGEEEEGEGFHLLEEEEEEEAKRYCLQQNEAAAPPTFWRFLHVFVPLLQPSVHD